MKKIIVLLTVLTNLLIISNAKANEIQSIGQRELDYSSQEKDQDFERYFFSNLAVVKSFIESACDNSSGITTRQDFYWKKNKDKIITTGHFYNHFNKDYRSNGTIDWKPSDTATINNYKEKYIKTTSGYIADIASTTISW
ncbi:hypothetical protein [Mycoplasma sp. P36-A1]|uniref:hypothetical protein n=1 Tax=Mycoplasma sp. P36-A1 TaxID=3252900 RepID=UPI003C2DD1E7